MTFRSDANAAYPDGTPVDKEDVRELWGAVDAQIAGLTSDIDRLEAQFLVGSRIVGDWNPASGAFPVSRPGGGAVLDGDQWNVIGTGTVDGVAFAPGDVLTALRNGGGVVYAGNWSRRAGTATAANQVDTDDAGTSVQDALNMSVADVQTLLDSGTIYAVGTVIHVRREGVSYEVAASAATNHDATTAGGIKLYRLRRKRVIFAYSQSNFAGKSVGTAWGKTPPSNLFVWNGGNWSPESEGPGFTPPIGNAFVPAADLPPQVPVAYAAELAESRPDEDWYLIIIARGGTGVRALVGQRYLWSEAVTGAPASGMIRLSTAAHEIVYSETDFLGYTRFLGGTSLGISNLYPARMQTTVDGGARWIDFMVTGDAVDGGTYRSQPITVVGENNWSGVAEGEDVTLYPSAPRMQDLFATIIPLAFAAMRLTGSARKIDRLLIWPTEADANYETAYRDVDFDRILALLNQWVTPKTKVLMTMPQPYGAGIGPVLSRWWQAIKDIAARDPDMRSVVSLSKSGAENWGDNNNSHAVDAGREAVGRFMRISEETGGTPLQTIASGFYFPVFIGVENVDTITPFEASYMRIGDVVTVQGRVQVDPTVNATATSVRISLPVPSDIIVLNYLSGSAAALNVADHVAAIQGDTTNDAASMTFTSRMTTPTTFFYNFSYRIRAL